MQEITLSEFKKIKWVQKAEKTGHGFKIKTRNKSLKTLLTHKVIDNGGGYGAAFDNRYSEGEVLPEPFSLILPQYWIHLESDYFDFTFGEYPGAKADKSIGFTPTYQGIYPKERWGIKKGVCYGDSYKQEDGTHESLIDLYLKSENWKERLIIAAMYLQSAEPHYGKTWYRTSYAARLGLVGEEFITISPDIETRRIAAEMLKIRREEQQRAMVMNTQQTFTQQQDAMTNQALWARVEGI